MNIYSTILLLRLAWADSCQILWISHIIRWYLYWPQFHAGNFVYPNIWAVNLIIGVFHLDVSSSWSRVIWAFFCVFWSFHSCRHWWSGGQGLQDIPHWSTYRHSWRPFWTCLCDLPVSLTQLSFMVKSKTSNLGTTPLRWRIFWLTDIGLKEFCCTFFGFRNILTLPQKSICLCLKLTYLRN